MMITIGFYGFITGYGACKERQEQIEWLNQDIKDFIFKCNPYNDDYHNCNSTKFMNITGLYCNDILICQNQLRG